MIKLKQLLKEEDRVLITRRSPEERQKNYQITIQRKIQQIKNGAKGDLILTNEIPVTIDSLPDNFHVQGNLKLVSIQIKSLPDNLKVDGKLEISECDYLKALPTNLIVGGDLDLIDLKIQALPANLSVGGDIWISDVNFKSLPNSLIINNSLSLIRVPIQILPDNLKVPGNLDLSHCEYLKSLPSNLIVGKDLTLKDCKNIKSLPDNLKVPGDLRVFDTNIQEIPKNLQVGNYFYFSSYGTIFKKYSDSQLKKMLPGVNTLHRLF
jgi:hypothetical protein